MRRRRYLELVSIFTAGIAGCNDTNGTTATTTRETTTSTTETTIETTSTTEETTATTADETTTETETTKSASFEVVGMSAPERVQVNEEHTISIEVRNTGGEVGTLEAVLEVSVTGTSAWEDIGEITVEEIPPGETKTWTSDPFSFEQPNQIQFRLSEYDPQISYEVFVPEPDVSFGSSRLINVDTGFGAGPMAEVEVMNSGDTATKRLEITVDWQNEAGEYLASSTASIQTLGSGETWIARVDPRYDVEDVNSIDGFEPNLGEVETATSLNPEGVTVVGDEMVASEQQVLVRGAAKNERDSELGYLEIVTKVHNSEGAVIGSRRTNDLDIPAGDQLRFELEPNTYGRNAAVDSYTIVLSDSTLTF